MGTDVNPKNSNSIITDPKEAIAEHIEVLKEYASKIFLKGKQLTDEEYSDKEIRFRELFGISASVEVTVKEIILLVFRGTISKPKPCGCSTCRARDFNG